MRAAQLDGCVAENPAFWCRMGPRTRDIGDGTLLKRQRILESIRSVAPETWLTRANRIREATVNAERARSERGLRTPMLVNFGGRFPLQLQVPGIDVAHVRLSTRRSENGLIWPFLKLEARVYVLRRYAPAGTRASEPHGRFPRCTTRYKDSRCAARSVLRP